MPKLVMLLFLVGGQTAFSQPHLIARLDSFFHSQPADQPGFALAIEKNGEVVYRNTAGLADKTTGAPLDTTTNFRMASVTKQFTAMGICLLEKQGLLSFDDPIRRWLPELPARIGNRILIRHLLTHSSGLPDYESLIPAERERDFNHSAETNQRLDHSPQDPQAQLLDIDVLHLLSAHDSTLFTPGSRFRYSNSGYCLLALVIERASKHSFPDFIRENIFLPLHMTNSTVYVRGQPISHRAMGYARDSAGHIIPSDQSLTSATKGDGGVYTSLADYSKWIGALQKNQLLRLAPLLRRLRFPISGSGKSYYAAGWFMMDTNPFLLFHSGSTCGFANFVIQIPADQWTIVYFSNLADNETPFKVILHILQQESGIDLSPVFTLHNLTR
jgi:CubicO group peptidase (beta-lactamase class C family)